MPLHVAATVLGLFHLTSITNKYIPFNRGFSTFPFSCWGEILLHVCLGRQAQQWSVLLGNELGMITQWEIRDWNLPHWTWRGFAFYLICREGGREEARACPRWTAESQNVPLKTVCTWACRPVSAPWGLPAEQRLRQGSSSAAPSCPLRTQNHLVPLLGTSTVTGCCRRGILRNRLPSSSVAHPQELSSTLAHSFQSLNLYFL